MLTEENIQGIAGPSISRVVNKEHKGEDLGGFCAIARAVRLNDPKDS